MSCKKSTAPLNINKNNTLKCDLKCEYIHNYLTNSNFIITNRKEYLSVRVEDNISNPVTFNSNKYNLSEIRIYNRSLHSWNEEHMDGEIVMVHNNILGNNGDLLVCIPIKKGNQNNDNSNILENIVLEASKRANSNNDRTVLSIDNYNLNKLIPSKPFYFYEGSLPYKPCNGLVNYIVFDENDSIIMNDVIYKKLTKLIIKNNYKIKKNIDNRLFYNINGPRKFIKDEIYIDCNPIEVGSLLNKDIGNNKELSILTGILLNFLEVVIIIIFIIFIIKKILN